jgi:aspartate 1-decarboxylase
MLISALRAKIHRATVTDADIEYEGSLTVDSGLLDAAGLYPFEKIQVYNITNGARFETYLMSGAPGSGVICVNGAAARLAGKDHKIIIAAYALLTSEEMAVHKPRIILLDDQNHVKQKP